MAEDKSWDVLQAEIEAQARNWTDDFEKSTEYNALGEEAGAWTYPVLHGFLSISVGEKGQTLSDLDKETLAWVLLEGMPREFIIDQEALPHGIDILKAFFQYSIQIGLLPSNSEILTHLSEVEALARRRMIDPSLWKPHKAVIIEALQAGVDLNDRKAMEKFYKRHQTRHAGSFVETIIADKTPGRNDTCLCGSGKKYKKCCGMTH